MFRTVLVFTFGVYLGQEYPNTLPNVKNESLQIYNQILESDFYKKVRDNYNKKN